MAHERTLGRCAGPIALMLAVALASVLAGAAAARAAAPTLRLGTQSLTRCSATPLAYCGTLAVPLDHESAASSPPISIAYRFYPASAGGEAGATRTVVPVEGGPGYPSIESVSYRSLGRETGYSAMYGALLQRSNMLVVDNRGTGESTPLHCTALQDFSGPTASEAFQQAAAGCAETLNHRWRYAGGAWVHASDMFSSAPAAQDLAGVIEALKLGKVDLYGDSYGSFFAQVFAARFPELVRSVTLDSTYETSDLDPWYRSTIESMPGDFDAVCARSAACASAPGASAWSEIGALAASLRQDPITARVPGPSGALEPVTMNVVGLVDLLSDAAEDTNIYRELDAAARALLGAGDADPLLRLYAQREYFDEGYFGSPVSEYSVELYVADACIDYPQLFDMSAPSSERASELAAAEAALAPDTFSPFTAGEWIAQNENTEAFSVCIGWPSPTAAQPPVNGPTPLFPPGLPVLVLGGELDTWTPPAGVPKVLAQIGGHSRFVELANSTHVVGEGDTECGSSLVQRFVADPSRLDSLDVSCAAAVPPIHAVGVYPATLAEQPPLQAGAGSSSSPEQLQLAAAAVDTAGDAIARYDAIEAKQDRGLEGGSVTARHEGAVLTLTHDQLVPGVSVSGSVTLTPSVIAANGANAVGSLTVRTAGARAISLQAEWSTAAAGSEAVVTGTSGKQPLSGTMPAP